MHICHLTISLGQEFNHSLAGSSAPGFLMEAIKMLARAVVSSEAWLEQDLLSSSCGCWKHLCPLYCRTESLIRLTAGDQSQGFFLPHGPFQHGQKGRESLRKTHITTFCNVIIEVISHHLCSVTLVRNNSQAPPAQGHENQRWESQGPSWSLSATQIYSFESTH